MTCPTCNGTRRLLDLANNQTQSCPACVSRKDAPFVVSPILEGATFSSDPCGARVTNFDVDSIARQMSRQFAMLAETKLRELIAKGVKPEDISYTIQFSNPGDSMVVTGTYTVKKVLPHDQST